MKLLKTIMVLVIASCAFLVGCTNTQEKSDNVKFKEEYESLNGTTREKDGKTIRTVAIDYENPMVYESAKGLVERIENEESFFVYFGFADCPWCRSVVETMIQCAKDNGVQTIYYVDVKEIRDTFEIQDGKAIRTKEGSDSYYTLLSLFDSVLQDYTVDDISTNEKRIFAPNVVSVINGKPNMLIEGQSHLQKDGYEPLTELMLKDSYKQFEELFSTQKDTACDVVETKC